jgi:hypothetical protein
LRAGHAHPIREYIYAGVDYQNKLARFLENHDEIPGSFHIWTGYPRSHRDREFSVFWFGFLPSRTLFRSKETHLTPELGSQPKPMLRAFAIHRSVG